MTNPRQKSKSKRPAKLQIDRPRHHRGRTRRGPLDPLVGSCAHRICTLLEQGLHPTEVARRAGVSREYVYYNARRYGRPTNRVIRPGTRTFFYICHAIVRGMPVETAARAYNVSEQAIVRMLRKAPRSFTPKSK